MPSLRQLECSLVLGSQGYKLPEYKLKYNDNSVECHIPTPDVQLPFSVHIVARGYHAPGLAAFVFIDGEYQCNRNQVQSDNIDAFSRSRQISAELRLRQKEEKLPDGTFIGREWTFSELKGGQLVCFTRGERADTNLRQRQVQASQAVRAKSWHN